MAMLEPCLPIWLMDNIHPKKWQLGTVFIPDSLGYMIGTNCFAVISLKVGRYKVALLSLLLVGLCCLGVTYAHQMLDLVLPHFGLGLGIGIIDSSLMPMLAMLVETRHVAEYGSVFALGNYCYILQAMVLISRPFSSSDSRGHCLWNWTSYRWLCGQVHWI